MNALDKLLAPYQAAVAGTPSTTSSLEEDPIYKLLFPAPSLPMKPDQSSPLPQSPGAWNELMIEQPGGMSTGLHLHAASSSLPLDDIARWAESKGFDVSQLLGFQGTNKSNIGGHHTNSYHYRVNPQTGIGEAEDINYYGGGRWDSEQQALNWLLGRLQSRW